MTSSVRTTNDRNLLVAGISAILDIPLQSSSPVNQSVKPTKVSLSDYHRKTYSYGQVGNTLMDLRTSSTRNSRNKVNQQIELYTKTLTGQDITVQVDSDGTTDDVRNALQITNSVATNQSSVIFAGKQLKNGRQLSGYGIQDKCTVHVVPHLQDGSPTILDPESMDPQYDHDFSTTKDNNKVFTRGSIKYVRPCGWKRFAIKVSDKFENMIWLGQSNSEGEWPVSYHGTGFHQDRSIAMDGYDLTKGKKFTFTYGVYSTPDIEVAEKYGVKFSYGNERYLILFQNRVNPQTLMKLSADNNGMGEYWVSPTDKDIRPYAVCIRKL
ncbi:hypothetical protein I4U23_016225 [Adineta vaga]|nr:hypothetical protein I4U23_016225 [Adineta vaga]